jgi:hypothetical protein
MYIERIGARKKKRRIHTTLGELVATISDIAFEYAADEKRPMKSLAGFWWAFSKTHRSEAKPLTGTFPASKYLH